eukprot:jgi/Bigna1/90751/estExt_fgenesh1_pg.C_780066
MEQPPVPGERRKGTGGGDSSDDDDARRTERDGSFNPRIVREEKEDNYHRKSDQQGSMTQRQRHQYKGSRNEGYMSSSSSSGSTNTGRSHRRQHYQHHHYPHGNKNASPSSSASISSPAFSRGLDSKMRYHLVYLHSQPLIYHGPDGQIYDVEPLNFAGEREKLIQTLKEAGKVMMGEIP